MSDMTEQQVAWTIGTADEDAGSIVALGRAIEEFFLNDETNNGLDSEKSKHVLGLVRAIRVVAARLEAGTDALVEVGIIRWKPPA